MLRMRPSESNRIPLIHCPEGKNLVNPEPKLGDLSTSSFHLPRRGNTIESQVKQRKQACSACAPQSQMVTSINH